MRDEIRKGVPGIEFSAAKAQDPNVIDGFGYDLANSSLHGVVRVYSTTSSSAGATGTGALAKDQTLNLPHVGLVIVQYDSHGRIDDNSPDRQALRTAFKKAVEPLMKFEPGAASRSRLELTDDRMTALAKTQSPTRIEPGAGNRKAERGHSTLNWCDEKLQSGKPPLFWHAFQYESPNRAISVSGRF